MLPKKYTGVGRPTVASAIRASLSDERKRKDKVEKEKTESGSVHGKTTVFERDLNHEKIYAFQQEKFDGEKNTWTDKNKGAKETVSQAVTKTGKNVTSSTQTPSTQRKEGKESSVDPAKYGATGGTSKGSGQGREFSSKAETKDSYRRHVSLFSHEKPLSYGADPYGYKVLSPAEARRYRDNVDFYKNVIRSKPLPGHTIEDMLKWKGNYEMLERNHSYIQWLFPIPESNGLNMYAQQLFEHEAKAIREDDGAQKRVLKAYRMMLDFYGMKLKDSIYGLVGRADKGWQDRYEHLNRSRHNLLRITRILKSLGELGYERFQARWVEFLIDEAVVNRKLPNLNGQCLMHWVMAVKDDGEREMLYRKANGLDIDEHNTQYGTNSESESEDDESEEKLDYDRPSISAEADVSKLTLSQSVPSQKDAMTSNPNASDSTHLSKPKMIISEENDTNIATKVPKNLSVFEKNTSNVQSKLPDSTHMMEQKENQRKEQKGSQTKEQEEIHTKEYKVKVTASTAGKKSTSEELQRPEYEKMETDQEHYQGNEASDNLKFYQDKILSRPSPGYTIETMLKSKGQHLFFEEYPGFIHWLFPIPSSVGVNPEAQVLHEHEAKAIREDSVLSCRVYEAFNVILDFYGMKLYNNIKGKFRRKKSTYKDRYDYLQCNPFENYRRITRVLVSIGELGLERFQVPWIEFLIEEGIDHALFPTLDGESIMHWICSIRDEEERQAMFRKYQKLAGHRPLLSPKETRNVEYRSDVYDTYNRNMSAHPNATRDYAEAEGGFNFLQFI